MENIELIVFSAAFTGFLTFLFTRLGDFFRAYYERISRGFITLVTLQRILNEQIDELGRNLFKINEIKSQREKMNQRSGTLITGNRPTLIPLFLLELQNLLNLQLCNDILIYQQRLKRYNDSISEMNCLLNNFQNAALQKTISPDEYKNTFDLYSVNLVEIEISTQTLKKNCFNLIAKVRVISKTNKPIFNRFTKIFAQSKYSKDFLSKVNKELKSMEKETKTINGKLKRKQ